MEPMTAGPVSGDRRVALGGGLSLLVDDLDSLGLLARGSYEPYETWLLSSLAAPGSVVIDVGANIGYYTVQFARAVGPEGRVVAVEPDPDNVAILRRNLALNRLHNVHVVPKAAAAVSGSVSLFRSDENRGDHRLHDPGDGRRKVVVEAVSLDEELAAITGPVSLVKLDIQGAEPGAVRGMARFLQRHPEAWIATELWPLGLLQSGSSIDDYLGLLRSLGCALLRIDEGRRKLEPLDLDWLAQTVTVERGNHTNLLLPRRDWVRRCG